MLQEVVSEGGGTEDMELKCGRDRSLHQEAVETQCHHKGCLPVLRTLTLTTVAATFSGLRVGDR